MRMQRKCSVSGFESMEQLSHSTHSNANLCKRYFMRIRCIKNWRYIMSKCVFLILNSHRHISMSFSGLFAFSFTGFFWWHSPRNREGDFSLPRFASRGCRVPRGGVTQGIPVRRFKFRRVEFYTFTSCNSARPSHRHKGETTMGKVSPRGSIINKVGSLTEPDGERNNIGATSMNMKILHANCSAQGLSWCNTEHPTMLWQKQWCLGGISFRLGL